jgi:butyryl-CoA dehydrogenase
MNFQFTEEQQLIAQSARDFAKEYLDPIAVQMDETGEFPKEVVKRMADHDFLGLNLPSEVGGAEAGFVTYVAVIEALSRSCAAVASIMNHHAMAGYAIENWGQESLKKQYLPSMAKGEILGALALYEHGATPGVGEKAVIATKREDGSYALKGAKAYVRNAGQAGVYVVTAVTEADHPKTAMAFVVDAKAPGLKLEEKIWTMGLRGCPVAHVGFEDVVVPESAVLGTAGGGTAIINQILALSALAEAAQTVGIGQAAVEHAAAYAKQRVQFGKPVFKFPAVQAMLADSATDCHVARLTLHHAAQLVDDGKPFEVESAIVKSFLTRQGSKILIDTCQVEGGMGYVENMPLPRLFRDITGTTLQDAPGDAPERTIAMSIG